MVKTYHLGQHAIFDVEYPKNHPYLVNPDVMIEKMQEAVEVVGATILNTQMHFFDGENVGYTFTIILAESHASCHTWPEHGIATFDIFMCGSCDAFAAQRVFLDLLDENPLNVTETKVFRGFYKVEEEQNA